MKMKQFCLLAGLLLLAAASAPKLAQSAEEDADCVLGEEGCPESEPPAPPSGTVDLIAILTDSDIQDSIKGEDMFVVVFYAPW